MIDEKKIGEELLAMHNEIVARDGRQPWASPSLNISDTGRCVVFAYAGPIGADTNLMSGSHDTVQEALDSAWDAIRALPTQEEARRDRFAMAIAAAIEAGNDAGLDLEYINPLQAMMKRLSENAITKKHVP